MSKARDLADTVSTGGILDDGTVSVSEISDLTVTAAELNNVAGVNSDVQTQLDLKAPLASPSFTGNVGIGTSSPDELLHIHGATQSYIKLTDNDSGQGATDGALFAFDGSSATQYIWNYENGPTVFATNGSERMRIDSSGNLLVGKTSTNYLTNGVEAKPDGSLWTTATNNGPLVATRKSSDGNIASFYKDSSFVGSIGALYGDIYVGTGNTGLKFTDSSSVIVPLNTSTLAERDAAISLGQSGTRFKDGYFSGTVNAANFNSTSDATLKTNVETLSGSLDAVKAMRGVSFDWIDSGDSEIGVIAQEVEEVLPELVNTNDNGIKSVKYGNIVAVLIEAIKEQQEQINELKAQLNS